MNNKKIAKELNRIAKTLVSNIIANNAGLYKNFTGIIDWLGSYGEVSNATFELNDRFGIMWHNGTWENGTWKDGFWYNGTWEKGTWKDGLWEYGTWKDGTWEDGNWENGVWEDGTWEDGRWERGRWYNGTWEKGNWVKGKDKMGHTHLDSPDKW